MSNPPRNADSEQSAECVKISPMNAFPLLILASGSPRRRELLQLGGWTFRTATPDVDESRYPGEHPAEYVRRLAETKARAVQVPDGIAALVLAADTTVADGEMLLGKPAHAAEARAMLQQLRGRTHQVYSGLALLNPSSGELLATVRRTAVTMRTYSAAEMEAYIASGDPLDKAGAYAIQSRDFQPVASLDGCLASVVGLPLCDLARLLNKMGVPNPRDLPQRCQSHFQHTCPVYEQILHAD